MHDANLFSFNSMNDFLSCLYTSNLLSSSPPSPSTYNKQNRISELEDFYTRHIDDERSVLFDKQRMKLRKLLHEYDLAVSSLQQQGGMGGNSGIGGSPSASQSKLNTTSYSSTGGGGQGQGGQVGVTRDITEKTRLTLPELSAWFQQAGFNELRDKTVSGEVRVEMTLQALEQVFRNVTRTNLDGKMSIRDIRQWYVSYGRQALLSGVTDFSGELVPSSILTKGAAATAAASARKAAAAVAAPPPLPKGIYSWEEEGSSSAHAVSSEGHHSSLSMDASGNGAPLLTLPNHMLEFQVRMSPDEFKAMSVKRRQYEGELRFKDRIAKAEKAKEVGRPGAVKSIAASTRDTKFEDPLRSEAYLFRN